MFLKVLSRWQTEMDQSIRGDQSARWLGLLPDQLELGPVAVEVAVGVEVGVVGHYVFVGPVQPSVIVLVAELESCAGGWIVESLDPADDLVLAEGGAVRAGHGIRRDAVDGVGDVALELGDHYVFVGPVQTRVIVLGAELESCAGGWIVESLDPADDLVLAEGGAVRAGHG